MSRPRLTPPLRRIGEEQTRPRLGKPSEYDPVKHPDIVANRTVKALRARVPLAALPPVDVVNTILHLSRCVEDGAKVIEGLQRRSELHLEEMRKHRRVR